MREAFAHHKHRRGSALLTVLGAVLTATMIAMLTQRTVLTSLRASRNRVAADQGRWNAEDCLSRVRAAWHDAVMRDSAQAAWSRFDSVVAASPLVRVFDRCSARLRATGSRIDVNAVDDSVLRALFEVLGASTIRAESLAAAVLDWTDADDMPRTAGAERDWYVARGLPEPSNSPIHSKGELQLIRGLEDSTFWSDALDVLPGRISLKNAPSEVLRSLPGSSEQFAKMILRQRDAGSLSTDLSLIAEALYPADRAHLWAGMDGLTGMTAIEPDSWVVESRGWASGDGVIVTLEVLLARSGVGTRVIRRREWLE